MLNRHVSGSKSRDKTIRFGFLSFFCLYAFYLVSLIFFVNLVSWEFCRLRCPWAKYHRISKYRQIPLSFLPLIACLSAYRFSNCNTIHGYRTQSIHIERKLFICGEKKTVSVSAYWLLRLPDNPNRTQDIIRAGKIIEYQSYRRIDRVLAVEPFTRVSLARNIFLFNWIFLAGVSLRFASLLCVLLV